MVFTKAQQEAIDWAIEKVNKYKKNEKIYNTSAIIFFILDFVCFFISIAYISTMAISLFASLLCKTVWGARTIQVVKISKLAQALKFLTAPSIAYIAVRKKRSEFMTNIKIKNWVVAILNAVALVFGVVMVFVEPSILTQNIELVICGLGSLLGVNIAIPCFNNAKKTQEEIDAKNLAKENKKLEKEAIARIKANATENDKILIEEEIAKIKKEQEEQAQSQVEVQEVK